MLSAFKAQAIHEFKPRDKSKIESLLAEGDRLLVGLSTGSLRVYRVNEGSKDVKDQSDSTEPPGTPTKHASAKAIELLREEEKFSKKPVLQLAIIKEANLLVSLSDGYVSFHDLQSYQVVERLEQTKGAACFVVNRHVVKDPETDVPSLISRLAVGVRKKVLCWTWQDSEMTQDVIDVTMEANVKTLTWSTGTRLIVGMDPGFSMLDLDTQDISPINNANGSAANAVRFAAVSSSGMGYMGMSSWVPKPMATPMTNNEVLLAKDVNTLFIDNAGTPLEKRQVPWHQAPEAIGYSYPYLLSLLPPEKGVLQIRNPDSLSLLQKIPLPGASMLHVPQPNISLAHAGKGFLVASERSIWRMNALPYPTQITELVEAQRYDEAVSFLSLLEDTLIDDKAGRIREVKIQKATDMFRQQNYRAALDLMTDAQAPVERVVGLYPKVISGKLSSTPDQEAEDVSSEAGGSRKGSDSVKEVSNTPSKGMLGRLIPGQARQDADVTSVKTPARTDTDNASIRSRTTPAKPSLKGVEQPLEGDDLKTAVHALSSFLAQARQQVRKYMNLDGSLKDSPPQLDPETRRPAFSNLLRPVIFDEQDDQVDWHAELLRAAQLVDTTLFKAYMLAVPSLAGPLFRQPNFCDPEVVQEILYEHDRYSDLIDFLHGKKLHQQALEMLQKFGKGEADAEIPDGMRGPTRTIAYLKQLPPDLIDIILNFIRWPIEQDPSRGMEVFMDDSESAENLPARRVVSFLADVDEKLEMQYLEHIINNLRNQDADFHQRLVDLYLQRLKSDGVNQEDKNAIQSKLQTLLQKSRLYNKAKTFRQLPADDALFHESRAIVLSAMGNHKQALSIYVYQIRDYEKAEDYCNKLYLSDQVDQEACLVDRPTIHHQTSFRSQPDSEENQQKLNIFAILLGLYLRPPPEEEKRWPQALDLLSKHGARLPASSTLDLMPDDLAVQELTDYFRGRIRNATSVLREGKVVRNLTGVKRDNTERQLLLGTDKDLERRKNGGRNRRVRITEEDHCKVCHKRFGASAIRVYPDNTVVHYGCVGKRQGEQRTWG